MIAHRPHPWPQQHCGRASVSHLDPEPHDGNDGATRRALPARPRRTGPGDAYEAGPSIPALRSPSTMAVAESSGLVLPVSR
jgi:hypothetical protein